MAGHVQLQPNNASPLRLTFAHARDPLDVLAEEFDAIRIADSSTPAQFLPWLVWEYGLGELSPYLPNLTELISEGIQWQRVRGTPAAVYRGLSWLGYAGTVVEEPARRRRWNRFQVALSQIRANDFPDLPRINGVVDLSPPHRSQFFRGFSGYDVRAIEGSYQRLSNALLSNYSGVRVEPGKAKWSFGRQQSAAIQFTKGELTSLGVWIEPVPTTQPWVYDNRPWSDVTLEWAVPAAQARINAIADATVGLGAYIRLKDAAGATIGFVRAVIVPVRSVTSGGEYTVNGTRYTADAAAYEGVIIKAQTQFGDGAGEQIESWSLIIGGSRAPGVPAGKLWLEPGEIVGGLETGSQNMTLLMGLTLIEKFTIFATFSAEAEPNTDGQPLGLLLALTKSTVAPVAEPVGLLLSITRTI